MNIACFMYFLMELIIKFVLESTLVVFIGSKLLTFFSDEPIHIILCTSSKLLIFGSQKLDITNF